MFEKHFNGACVIQLNMMFRVEWSLFLSLFMDGSRKGGNYPRLIESVVELNQRESFSVLFP